MSANAIHIVPIHTGTYQNDKQKAEEILGLDIKGHVVKRVMIAEGANIAQEFYFSVLLDRSNRTFLSLCSVFSC